MGLTDFLRRIFSSKKGRGAADAYPTVISDFFLPEDGKIQLASPKRPAGKQKKLTQSELNFYKQFIKKGSMAIDIGAGLGEATVAMAVAAGKDGVTLGFNHNRMEFQVLEANAGLNKEKTNMIALPYAIIKPPAEGSREIVLEEYLRTQLPHWLPKLSFIKIDADEMNGEFLKPLGALIDTYHPVIASECTPRMNEAERELLYNNLTSKNYNLYFFEAFEENAAIIPLAKNDMMRWEQFNFYATTK